jgi:ABC-type uncharacterized transport system permease subunit
MILLHLAVAALYALAAWALWPAAPSAVPAGNAPVPRSAMRPSAAVANWLVPLAIALHAVLVARNVMAPEGLDLNLENAVSVVAGLVAAVAWFSGLVRTLPSIGVIVLPIAAIAAVLPAIVSRPHPFIHASEPWAGIHIAVAWIAYALFIVAAVQALVLMGLEKRLHRRLPDPGADSLPPLLTLERFLFRLVGTAFVLLSFTVVTGILFSEQVFGRPVMFTHKSVLGILGWITFGGLLWGRWRYGWRGRVALRWILAGTLFVFLAYLGSKFVLEVLLGR